MGRPAARIVLLIASAIATVAVVAVAPVLFNARAVLAAASSAVGQHSCGGG